MELTADQLRAFNMSEPDKSIYVSIKSAIYDVSSAPNFYGPRGSFSVFAGHVAARALPKMSKDACDVNDDLSSLSEKEMGVLAYWEKKFQAMYPVVGRLLV